MDFNELYWHDAVIKNIQIDRSDPGEKDTILLNITWPNGLSNKVIFEDVFWSKMILGFGVVADECISEAIIAPSNDSDLTSLYARWRGLINDSLLCYIIKTASTGSEIKIISKNMKVI